MRKRVTPDELAASLRALGANVPRAALGAVRETALELAGAFVQIEIATTRPHQPVDQGQYKAAWRHEATPYGAVVFNLAKHAVFVERGRPPGGSIGGLMRILGPWARRHKIDEHHLYLIARKIVRSGVSPRWVLKRANVRARVALRRRVAAAMRKVTP